MGPLKKGVDLDLVVVGGGAGGLVAAREATKRGARVALVQNGPIGGDCTFTGCIPSKAMIAAAGRGDSFAAAHASVRRTVDRVAATEDSATLRREGIDVIEGFGRFCGSGRIEVDGRVVRSRRFIIATGSRPRVPAVPGLSSLPYLTNETFFSLADALRHLAILGGGAIGCEIAQACARLGVGVTVIESGARLLPAEEPKASAVVTAALRRDGVVVRTEIEITSAERSVDGQFRLHLDSSERVTADQVLVAVGRVPASGGFGLEELGVAFGSSGEIEVDDTMATNVRGVWAVGDVTGRLMFTHAAARMAWVAVSNALSRTRRIRPARFASAVTPWVTFTSPEVGRVGLTEAQAAQRHRAARVAHLPMTLVDRAATTGDDSGFVTLIAVPRRVVGHLGGGRLVGATVVSPNGGEMIHEAALAIHSGMFVGRLAQTTHAYPTWSMAMQQAALQFFGESVGLRARPARVGEGP